jgi:hypothetical protein
MQDKSIFFTYSITLVNALLTIINLVISNNTYKLSKKKDFQENLYYLKLEAYNEITRYCYKCMEELSIQNNPINKIYDITDMDEWQDYCKTELDPLYKTVAEIENLSFKHYLILPSDFLEQINAFRFSCFQYLCNVQNLKDSTGTFSFGSELWNEYHILVNKFRKDLSIQELDKTLAKRIKGNINKFSSL